SISTTHVNAAETVRVSLFSWPGYGFWFIAKEKGLAEGIELDIKIIEDPYESFAAMAAGQLDITSSTVEYGPIAAEEGVPVKLVAYTNPSIGTDKIILAPDIKDPAELKGKKVAVMEGGLTQIYMGIWLEENGLKFDDVTYVNLIMDDAVGAMVSGEVSAGEFWEPFGTNVVKNLEGSRVVATSDEEYWRSTALLADGMYMGTEFIDSKPEAAAAAMKAYYSAVDWWKANPTEGNAIIAKALQFPVADVELVIGADGNGQANIGGLWPFTLDESARFMKLKDGPVPIGGEEGINAHWKLTNEWWVKFGVMKEMLPPTAGIDMRPMQAILE
ncbi:MAG: ABC transporter substrate-binding protein, partial [Pseudomonadota bacterium]